MKREGTRKMEKKKIITVIGRKLWKWDIQMRANREKKKKSISKKMYQMLKFSQRRTKHLGVDLAVGRSAEA